MNGKEEMEPLPEATPQTSGTTRVFIRIAGLFKGGPRELAVPTEKRIPYLDALRSVAVLLVVNHHFAAEFAAQHGSNRYTDFKLTTNGWIGVDLFFVLSGYFIGSQLWKELSSSSTVSVGRFMIRRGLRIWPLYFFVFIAISLLAPGYAASKQHGWSDLLFVTNYVNRGIVMGGWSLCSEEQFYLLAPLLLLMIGPRSMRAYRWGLSTVLLLVCVVRSITYFKLTGHWMGTHPEAFKALYYPFHTHCDGLITGLIVANLAASKARIKGLLARPLLLIAITGAILGVLVMAHVEAQQFLGLALFFAALVWWGVKNQTKLFQQHVFYLLSRLSFGMYLNHDYMVGWMAGRVLPALGLMRLGGFTASIAGFLLIAVCSACLSGVTFCLVEHPFLMIRTAVLGRKVNSPLVAH